MTFKGINYKEFLLMLLAPFVFFPALADDELRPRGKKIYLRHDIDMDPGKAAEMAKIERDVGIKATYFVLDTAKYFQGDISKELEVIKSCGHEIGWHNDALQAWHKDGMVKPIREYIEIPLNILRDRYGCKVRGTAAHFVQKPWEDFYSNYHIWKIKYKRELKIKVDQFDLSEFGLEYETYKIEREMYLCDSGNNWNINPMEAVRLFNEFEDYRLQLLIHPQWWTL